MDFEEFLRGLQRLREPLSTEGILSEEEKAALSALQSLPEVSLQTLATLVHEHPAVVPLLVSCVGLGLEQLRAELRHKLGTSGWIRMARQEPARLIKSLDEAFGIVEAVRIQREKDWTFADILIERRLWSQHRASSSMRTGRSVEDIVEGILKEFGVQYDMRTVFEGRGGQTAPCDFAIPSGGKAARIVGAAKGFDSTGSKLTDAVREIEKIADVRLPVQYVFVFVDGIGWLRRQADLRRIYDLWSTHLIDGLYTLSRVDIFREDLRRALVRFGYEL